MNPVHDHVAAFIRDTSHESLPKAVQHQARRCLLDLIGVAAAGTGTQLSTILRDHVADQGLEGGALLLFDGRRAAAPQAALANAGTIDSMDGHDGHRMTKGHAGAAVLPAVLAFIDDGNNLEDLLTALVVGYEVSLRAGVALHETAADYHSSGAWNALGAAAIGARFLGLGTTKTAHALGIAEYSAPRGPMMRVIQHPTMVKDSSAWGAQAGVSAALLAARGFTGAPAGLVDALGPEAGLGERWMITEQYFKPYPVCRWAHPAIQAGLALMTNHGLTAQKIHSVEVATFDAATRLRTRNPLTTEEAQYSLPFSLAAALVHGELVPESILVPQDDTPALALAGKIRLTVSARMTEEFPAVRQAQVSITTTDGRTFHSYPTEADGDPETPLDDPALVSKFHKNTLSLEPEYSEAIAESVLSGDGKQPVGPLMKLLVAPPRHAPTPEPAPRERL